MTGAEDFEQLGAFYLGRAHDVAAGRTDEAPLFYDARDLTTHAVCVGMTGSGKTGLCISLLEEAALDGVPALVIDPKGDMGNLLLCFPDLEAASFEPWIDPGEARRAGRTPAEHAAAVAARWREGLADWGQDGERIRRFREAVDLAIFTPGSDAGLPLSVLCSFDAPPPALRADAEALAERAQSAAAALLALVGVDAHPLQSREAILIANLLTRAWQAGRGLTLGELVRQVQAPPIERLGVLELESFFPARDRGRLAVQLNGVLAAPGFATWLEGEPLDVARLLHTPEGKPRISILSIAHLSEPERMSFVTLLLNEVVTWMRAQAGTSSLRAILYMDEIQGYFPPTAEPPSKRPMLTLLKQARAYGLGCVLSTQNPVDLDYKGLSNAGTWFIGRLQTERDKLRVLDGLEGAAGGLGRAELDRLLSALDQRVFLLHDVHQDGPVTFRTRWALCYLRGPLTRDHVAALMAPRKAARAGAVPGAEPGREPVSAPVPPPAQPAAAPATEDPPARPVLPAGVEERFLAVRGALPPGERLVYRPALLAEARLHYVDRRADLDVWRELAVSVPLEPARDEPDWDAAELGPTDPAPELRDEPEPGASFEPPPASAGRARSYASWRKELAAHLYRTRTLALLRSEGPALTSAPGEREADFRARLADAAREARDLELERLRARHAPALARIEERLRKAEQKLDREEQQYSASRRSSWLRMGSTLIGSLFGRKLSTTAREVGTSVRSIDRASKERGDVERAELDREAEEQRLRELEETFRAELAELEQPVRPDLLELEPVVVRPRKSDVGVTTPALLWRPWRVDARGLAEPAWEPAGRYS